MPHTQVTLFDVVCNKEVPHIEVPHASGAGEVTVFLKQNCALVVLVQDCIGEVVTLGAKKAVPPEQYWHYVIGGNQFCLGRAAGVDFLFC